MTKQNDSHRPFGALTDNLELRQLVAAQCNGTATAEQWARLSDLITQSPENLEYYVAHLSMHSMMAQLTADFSCFDEAATITETLHAQLTNEALPTVSYKTANRPRRRKTWPIWSSIALLALIIATVPWYFPQHNEEASHPIATAWVLRTNSFPTYRPLAPGDSISQKDGNTKLAFRSGVQLTLTGPANLELLTESTVRLNAGQIQVDVGPNGKGFRVLTPTTDVLDLGTVFGMQVSPQGATDVVVFDGEIKLRPSDPTLPENQQRRPSLFQGEAVRIDPDGKHARIPTIWQAPNSNHWSTEKPSQINSPIVAVYDNLTEGNSSKYYAVVPGGFREDAKVYVDRNYEWNSRPGIDLPYELLGADYIQTFNDDKYQDQLEIQLELDRPVILYILWDPRHLPPPWLLADFEPTGQQLGMDLGDKLGQEETTVPAPGIAAKRNLGRGAGQSVDIPFVVWRKVVPNAGLIRLGANGPRSEELKNSELAKPGSMYGIVVRTLHP